MTDVESELLELVSPWETWEYCNFHGKPCSCREIALSLALDGEDVEEPL